MAEAERKTIGALWTKKDKNGNYFFSGMIELGGVKQDIVVFKNRWKEESKPNAPDWKILKSEPRQPKQDDPF